MTLALHAMTERSFTTSDGVRLFFGAWEPATPSNRAVLLLHRGHEHSGRLRELAENLDGSWIFAWDQRGNGRSPGSASTIAQLTKDLDEFVRFISAEHAIPIENVSVVASSVAAVVTAAWVHDYAPPIHAMVLATPAFRVKLYIPFALPLLRLKQALFGPSTVTSYVKPSMLTHDAEMAASYAADPLISRDISVDLLIDLFDTSTRLLADADAIRVPTLILSAGSDWVVHLSAQRRFFDALGSPAKEMETYAGFHHALFHERDRHRPIARAREFLQRTFRSAPAISCTHEFDRLSRPLPVWSPRRWGFALQRLLLKTIGRLSEGVRIGWRTGFDSGQSLDYVYENRARGTTPLGRWIDRAYLDTVGWKGIRQRKANLQAALRKATTRGARIVDIAAGPGRYLIEVIKEHPDAEALLRDRSPSGLDAGRKLAQEMGVTNAVYAEGDAFDRASVASVGPRDIAIVSGLYELFPDNDLLRRSLAGLHDALTEDGVLIYTNQPWHPQVEMIARVLINRDGKPWIMRRRSQAEMDQLVCSAGFEKFGMEIDTWGIFSVSVARKRR